MAEDRIKEPLKMGVIKQAYLLKLGPKFLTEEEKEFFLNEYKGQKFEELSESQQDYWKLVREEKKPLKIDFEGVFPLFLKVFEKQNGVKWIETPESMTFLKTITYYLLQDPRFFKSSLIYGNPSTEMGFSKGLLVIGNYGTGKSSTFKALHSILSPPNINRFAYNYTVREVQNFDGMQKPEMKDNFFRKHQKGVRCYDDLLAENVSNNFGKKELFQEILLIRAERNLTTHAVINFNKHFPGNVEQAVRQIWTRYGDRVGDRVEKMFYKIVCDWGSFRE